MGYQSRLYTEQEIPDALGHLHYHGGVRYPDTFGINAFAFCQALKNILIAQGVSVYEQSPVSDVGEGYVAANGYTVRAENIMLCTDRFLPELGVAKPYVYQAQTFLGMSKPLPADTITAMFPKDRLMVWDTDMIYQYYRLVEDNRLLIGAASVLYTYLPFEIRHPENVVHTMFKYLKRKCPKLNLDMEYVWPGLIGVSKDFIPVVGQDRRIFFMAAATGLPWAAALGRYLADKILTGRDDFDAEFSPGRKYPIGRVLQSILRKPISFALSHGIVKYF